MCDTCLNPTLERRLRQEGHNFGGHPELSGGTLSQIPEQPPPKRQKNKTHKDLLECTDLYHEKTRKIFFVTCPLA